MKILHKLITLISLTAFPLIIFGKNIKEKRGNQKDSISYSVTIDKGKYKVAKVKVSFTPKDSILYMNPGAQNLPKRWATFIHKVKVIDEFGNSIKVEELPDAKWKILTSLNKKIILTYDVHLDHEDYKWNGGIDGVAYTTEMGVFYTGRALLIMNGNQFEDIQVNFKLPEDWSVTTPWNKITDTKHSFKVNNISDLANSMIFAGNHKEISFKREDFELIFALCTEDIIVQEDEFRNLAKGVLDYYIELMGGIPKPQPENQLNKVVVVISSSKLTDGEVIGNNISVLIEKDGDQLSKTISRFIFAHEFFHLWNGKSFSPADDETEWFKEGFTNYYTLKALYHVGFLNEVSYLDFLNTFFYQKYITDKGTSKLSMTNGAEKHDHWGLIYSGGMFVGISQDIIIRNATSNKKSIDDLMRILFRKYGGSNANYTMEELRKTMSDLSGIDQTKFFDTYIIGTKMLPIVEYLKMAGLNAKIENENLELSKIETITPDQQNILNGILGRINKN